MISIDKSLRLASSPRVSLLRDRTGRKIASKIIGMQTAFAIAAAIPRAPLFSRSVCRRTIPVAKKGGRKKREKSARESTKPSTPELRNPENKAKATPDIVRAPVSESENFFPGPVAPQFLTDGPIQQGASLDPPELQTDEASSDGAEQVKEGEERREIDAESSIPIASESRIKLPELVGSKGVKRKRKPRRTAESNDASAVPEADAFEDDIGVGRQTRKPLPTDKIRELTAAYRSGGDEPDVLLDEIEKDPDFMFQTGNPEGEYDLASAIIGTGRPNKQGLYVLPYLQSGHILLLLIVLLCTFVYYPGFPLTELDDSIRTWLQRGLALTYTFNAGLGVLAFQEAKKRGQPATFWGFKTAFLGNLALSELRNNAPLQKSE